MTTDASDRPSRRWRRWYLAEAILLGLWGAAAVAGPFYLGHVEYMGGLNNRYGHSFKAAMLFYPVFAVVGLVLFTRAVIQLFFRPRTWRHMVLRIGLLIAVPVVFVGGLAGGIRGWSNGFLRGYEKWVLQEVDIDAIQHWLATDGHKYAGKGHYSLEGLPGFLTDFEPTYISFPDSALQDGPCVKFQWGGPLGHWGVVIGLPTMPTPEEDPADLGPNEVEIRRSIKPGVYIFEQG